MKDAAFYPVTSPQQANYHAKQLHNALYVSAIQNFDPANVWLDPRPRRLTAPDPKPPTRLRLHGGQVRCAMNNCRQ